MKADAPNPRDLLRAAGLRVTAIRLAMLEVLGKSRAPLSAQELTDQLGAKTDRVTVYRTLNSLVESGLAHKVDPGDRVFRFGLTGAKGGEASQSPDQHPHQHPHFVCDACGNVECLEDTEVIVQRRTPRAGSGTPAKKKMRLSAQDVLLHGTCEDCGDAPERPAKRGRG